MTKAWKKVDNQEEADAANVEAVEVFKKYWEKKCGKLCGARPSPEKVHRIAGKTIIARKMATVVKPMKK